ncbi:MAG: hypothetical protein A2017_02945 [Lentisphaerae bacterium GWF2_44_16]|nr:MAG: hypothetical protein A2017_02945 [Lentisphaerae bacterium GWF2_44_16]
MISEKNRWMDGGVDAYFFHEPLIFLRRRGAKRLDMNDSFLYQHSEKHIESLKKEGIELVIFHYHKGFGPELEEDEMPLTEKGIRRCRNKNIRTGVYIRIDNIITETFLNKIPEAENWLAVDSLKNNPYAIGLPQYFRKRVCLRNPGYRQYLEKIIKRAVKELDVDVIHFDGAWMGLESHSCQCDMCRKDFLDFLYQKYPDKTARKERFGYSDLNSIGLPHYYDDALSPFEMETISDPVMQEWIIFRCRSHSETMRTLAGYAREEAPSVVIEANYMCPSGGNLAYLQGVWDSWSIRELDAIWSETSDDAELCENGVLVSRARAFKKARTCSSMVFYIPNGELSWWEGIVFGNGAVRFKFNKSKFIPNPKFTKNYKKELINSKSAAEIAVLHSFSALAYNSRETHRSVVLMEQALLQSNIHFDIIFDEDLAELNNYKALVLPDVECLTNEQCAKIKGFVKNGGGVLATEKTSLFDEYRRERRDFALSDLFKISIENKNIENINTHCVFGKGRVAYLGGIVAGGKEEYTVKVLDWGDFGFTKKNWFLPENTNAIRNSINWIMNYDCPVDVYAPYTLLSNIEYNDKKFIIHLLNYDTNNKVYDLVVRIRKKLAGTTQAARLIIPGKKEKTINLINGNEKYELIIPEIEMYALVILDNI